MYTWRLLAVGRRRQGDHPEDARADTLGDGADRPALAGPVTSLEHDDDAQALLLDPSLQVAQPDLEFLQRFLVLLTFHRLVLWIPVVACRLGPAD